MGSTVVWLGLQQTFSALSACQGQRDTTNKRFEKHVEKPTCFQSSQRFKSVSG
jgi:hypothetical protein